MQPFARPGDKIQVSTSGGGQPQWRRDGKEMCYIALDGPLMAVAIGMAPGGLEVGTPTPLFMTHVGGAIQSNSRQPTCRPLTASAS